MAYFLRRIMFYLAALWAAVTLNFFIPRLMPGNPVQILIARYQGKIDARAMDALSIQLGVNNHAPLPLQYLDYLHNLLRGDLGISIYYFPMPVIDVIRAHLIWTLGLVGTASIISFGLGTLLGVFSAWRRGSLFDRVLPPVLTIFSSVPYFYLAIFLLYFLGLKLRWFPIIGAFDFSLDPSQPDLTFYLSVLNHAILPATSLVLVSLGGWMLGMRNAMINTLAEDYVLMARAKGLQSGRVMLAYAARNAILPNVTGFALSLGFVLGGAIFMEAAFSYPGIGFVLLQAVKAADYPLIQALFMLIAIAVLLANFIADLVYLALDPRVRH